MTCNPNWPEIRDQLLPSQSPHHRPDIIARVFQLKKNVMIKILTKNCIFGKAIAYVSSIEWQKRGLPHAHILLWLDPRHQIRPASIDAAISAELPNPENDSELHQIILTHMIHGPCGSLNPSSPCMRDGACSKMYPKEFLDQTESGIDGYPHYRRRKPEEGGHHATKTTCVFHTSATLNLNTNGFTIVLTAYDDHLNQIAAQNEGEIDEISLLTSEPFNLTYNSKSNIITSISR